MRTSLLLFIALCLHTQSIAQIIFEKGYIIDNANKKTVCLIKNTDWVDNPKRFEYKLDENSTPLKGDLSNVLEFGIDGVSKYVNRTVAIDRSSDDLSTLSNSKEPLFETEQLFLQVLIEGSATLYGYKQESFERYFYQINDSTRQLIYKRYNTNTNLLAINRTFHRQLLKDISCGEGAAQKVAALKYDKASLVRYFEDYFACKGEQYHKLSKKKAKSAFHLSLTPGAEWKQFTVGSSSFSTKYPLSDQIGVRLGLMMEVVLPFNKNKWSVFAEPTFQSFKGTSDDIAVDYRSIEVPVGARYALFLKNKSKIILTGAGVLDIDLNSTIDFAFTNSDPSLRTNPNFALGVGYGIKKWTIEARYYSQRDLFDNKGSWYTDYNKLAFILGYRLF